MPDLPSLDASGARESPGQDRSETVGFVSSLVTEATYDPSDQTLDISFIKGESAAYGGITPLMWANMKASPSGGRFYLNEIRGRFPVL